MIGALDPASVPPIPGASCHQPIIHIYRIVAADGVTTEYRDFVLHLDQDFYLDVEINPVIEVFQKDEERFNRLDEVENNKKDFRWVVDFNDVHSRTEEAKKVEILEAKLKPKFNLNSGVFHASKLSDGEVKIRPNDLSKPATRFGRFATEITARIVLASDDQAVLRNGDSELRILGSDTTYRWEIVFDCTCRDAKELVSDFSLIYDVVKEKGGSEIRDKISLDPPETDPKIEAELSDSTTQTSIPTDDHKTPEVYCFGGNG
jgi:hypothetical protein